MSDEGDSIIIEMCSSVDTKFVRLNLATGETQTVDPESGEHSGDDKPLTQDSAFCSLASHVDFAKTSDLDWTPAKRFVREQAVVFLRRVAIAAQSCLPALPARGPPPAF